MKIVILLKGQKCFNHGEFGSVLSLRVVPLSLFGVLIGVLGRPGAHS